MARSKGPCEHSQVRCVECQRNLRKEMEHRTAIQRERLGLPQKCARCPGNAREGKVLCLVCSDKQNTRYTIVKDAKRTKPKLVKLCRVCDKQGHNSATCPMGFR